MENQKIIDKLDKLNNMLEAQGSDKQRINDIDVKLDEVQLTLQGLVTMVEYEAVNSGQNAKDLEELKKLVDKNYFELKDKQHEQDKSNSEIKESLSYIKKFFYVMTTAIISGSIGIIFYLIKNYMGH